MSEAGIDNLPPGKFGTPIQVGETYVDTVTGQFKQKVLSGPDTIINIVKKEDSQPTTSETYSDAEFAPLQELIDKAKHRSGWDRFVGRT